MSEPSGSRLEKRIRDDLAAEFASLSDDARRRVEKSIDTLMAAATTRAAAEAERGYLRRRATLAQAEELARGMREGR